MTIQEIRQNYDKEVTFVIKEDLYYILLVGILKQCQIIENSLGMKITVNITRQADDGGNLYCNVSNNALFLLSQSAQIQAKVDAYNQKAGELVALEANLNESES